MTNALLLTLGFACLSAPDRLVGSVWSYPVASGCINQLSFRANNQVVEYSCEQLYASHGTYTLQQDRLILLVRDDSHTEDGGKPILYRTTCRLTNKSTLKLLRMEKLVNRAWQPVPQQRQYAYRRVR